MENILNLESEIRELSKKCELENVLREELSLEIHTLQRSKSSWNPQPARETPEPFEIKTTTPLSQQLEPDRQSIFSTESRYSSTRPEEIREPPTNQPVTSVKYSVEGSIVCDSEVKLETKVEPPVPTETVNTEINRILARIQQDNRLLAELEKSRGTVDVLPLNIPPSNPMRENTTLTTGERNFPLDPPPKKSVSRQELEQLMAKLEQDNRILAELDKKRRTLDCYSATSLIPVNSQIPYAPSPSLSLQSLRDPSLVHQVMPASASSISLHHHTLIPTAHLQRLAPDVALTEEEMLDSIDFIELPGRGHCNIYCARYTYDPFKQSPNENPEAELALNAGDYVIIYGEMDEDGFFNGELLDGRKGLVPSNFVEKLTGEELFEFHATVLYGNRDSDDSSVSFSYAQDIEMTISDDLMHPDDFHRMNDYIDLEDIEDMDQDNDEEKDNENFVRGVPPPQRLILERQMNKSLLIGWVPPDVKAGQIEGYHVYVDGVPKATIQFAERTRALIEGVDSSRPHRISVRSISSVGYHSKDAACTIVVGKDFPLAPTCVKASHITASSALISWLPSNSNFQHVIAVNSVEVKVVKPGCFRHLVTGLSPNNLYRVSVRVKPGKLLYNDEKNPKKLEMLVSNVEFRTLPKGLPDPPVNIAVEQGPQDGTLLVTWLPVHPTVSTSVAPVTGYGVFAAGRQIAEVESPTGDHALIDGSKLLVMNKKCLTVKSKCTEGFSSDSLVCVIPNELLRNMQKIKQKMLCKAESINETEDITLMGHARERIENPMKVSHAVGRINETTNPKDQGWKDQWHNSRMTDDNDQTRGRRNQLFLEQDQSPEVYLPANKSAMDDQYDPRVRGIARPSSPQQRRPETEVHHSSNLRTQRGPQSQHRSFSRRQSHESTNIPSPRVPASQDRKSSASRNHIQGNPAPPGNNSYSNRRRSTNGGNPRKMADYHDNPMMGYHQDYNNTDVGDNRVRFFVALFDYDPQTMSPNPDAADEELPFQEGQIIKIYGDKDPDGFYRGESNGRVGLVPGNMVSEVQGDGDSGHCNENTLRRSTVKTNDRNSSMETRPIKKMVAIYDYDPQEISPNVDAEIELSFRTGDIIYVIGDVDEDGFFMGELNGVKGLVPSNFLREVPTDEGEKPRRSKGSVRDEYPHMKNVPEAVDCSRQKSSYTTNSCDKGYPHTFNNAPLMWDYEKDSKTRGPHIPPRAQRMAYSRPSQHW